MSQRDAVPALRSTWASSAVAAVDDVRAGRQSSLALVEEARRIETGDPSVRAIAELRADAALEEAAAVDRGEPAGPLAGVPITIKAAIPVAGMRSTWRLEDAREHRADRDAAVVAHLRGAGQSSSRRLTVHQKLADFTRTGNPPYGRTSNSRAPSTGLVAPRVGRPAAVAAGFFFLGGGSDRGHHSIRSYPVSAGSCCR